MAEEKLTEFDGKIDGVVRDTELEETEILRLVKSNIISERFGMYLTRLSNLAGTMRLAEICTEYGQDNGRITALENAERRLESAVAVYLSSDEKYGWTGDKMYAYMAGKFPEGHKELIDWAMEMKKDRTGERVYAKGHLVEISLVGDISLENSEKGDTANN